VSWQWRRGRAAARSTLRESTIVRRRAERQAVAMLRRLCDSVLGEFSEEAAEPYLFDRAEVEAEARNQGFREARELARQEAYRWAIDVTRCEDGINLPPPSSISPHKMSTTSIVGDLKKERCGVHVLARRRRCAEQMVDAKGRTHTVVWWAWEVELAAKEW